MKRCVECGGHALTNGEVRDEVTVAGHRFSALIPAMICADCGASSMNGPDLGRFELMVARELANLGEHSGEAVRYMRKALGMKAVELAVLLDVTAESVSRWENGKSEPPRDVVALLAAMADDRLDGRTTTLMRLRAMTEAHPSGDCRDLGRISGPVAA